MMAMAVPFVRGSRWGVLAGAGIVFLAATLLDERVQEPPVSQGLARITVEVRRTGCGIENCTSDTLLQRCLDVDTGACPRSRADRIALVTNEEPPLGAQVTTLARLSPRLGFRNPGPHPAWSWARPMLRANARLEGSVPRVDRAGWLGTAITAARVHVRHVLDDSLTQAHAGVARALLLGDGAAVERDADSAIRQAGLSHVLAVSGMHVTLFAGALVALVRRLWLRSPGALHLPAARVGGALGVLLAPLVACLCGGAPSAWRAAWTSTLVFAVQALGARPCPIRVCAFAVAVHCVIEPSAAKHPGFVLSVIATMALLTAQRGGQPVSAAVKESVRAWLATAPFLIWVFGSTSLVALPANVLLLPLGALLIPLSVLHLAAALAGLGAVTAWAFEIGSGAFVGASRLLAALDPGVTLPPLTPLQGSAFAALSLVWLTQLHLRTKLALTCACVLVAGAAELALRYEVGRDELRITFLDVGQGDATLLELGTGETLLIDGGGSLNGSPDPGTHAIVPLLRGLRVDRLDAVVLSHPHPDHYGGLFAVLESFAVSELWDSGQARGEGGSGAASQLLALAEKRGAKVLSPRELCGRARGFGALALQVLAPCPGFDDALDANDNSLVIKATHGKRSLLFTGDVERAAESALVARASELRADVLKVPHHGSRTSSSEAFVRAVAPSFAVVSAGRGNRFGHPHAEVDARLHRLVPRVLRLDQLGGVRMLSNGKALTLEQ
jgi:competence protein ComEC